MAPKARATADGQRTRSAASVGKAGRERLYLPDGLHFNEGGYALLGRVIANLIRNLLSSD